MSSQEKRREPAGLTDKMQTPPTGANFQTHGPTFLSVRRLSNLKAALREINRRPYGVDGIKFDAYLSVLDYALWDPNVIHVFDDRDPLKYLQFRMLYQDAPDPAEQIYANGRLVERGTTADSIINRGLARKMNINFDPHFSELSWGYRAGRSPELAIQRVRRAIRNGMYWALKTDVKRFFANIDRAILRQQLDATVRDQELVELIMSQISPVLITRAGRHIVERVGLPEGNGLTPLLSNIYMDGFDRACSQSFAFYSRYADDILLLGYDKNQVVKARRLIELALNCLGLELNRHKTLIRDLRRQPVTFLGYELRGGSIYPPPKAIRQLAQNLRVRGHVDRKAVLSSFVRRYAIGPVRKLFRRLDRTFNQLLPPGITLVALLDEVRARSATATQQGTETIMQLGTSQRRGRLQGTENAHPGRPPQSPRPGAAASSDATPPALRDCLQLPGIGRRDPAYLDFIRSRPCAFCANPAVEPHHTLKGLRGISEAGLRQKGSDYLSIPVCRTCHTRLHSGDLRPSRTELLELVVIYLVCFLDANRRGLR